MAITSDWQSGWSEVQIFFMLSIPLICAIDFFLMKENKKYIWYIVLFFKVPYKFIFLTFLDILIYRINQKEIKLQLINN